MKESQNPDFVLTVPEIANVAIDAYSSDLQMMEQVQKDTEKCKGYLRDAFLELKFIKKYTDKPLEKEIHVVDGSSVTQTGGEFATMLALGVNISTHNENHFKSCFRHVCAPNSEMFGAASSPIRSACELLSLADDWDDGYTLYDGSFQSLNMNLGNLFRTQDAKEPYLSEITSYSQVFSELFDEIVHQGKYARVFTSERSNLFAISKRSTSAYTFNRIQQDDHAKLKKIRQHLGDAWFSYPKSDRLILNQVLQSGEFIGPVPFSRVESRKGSETQFGLSKIVIDHNPKLEQHYKNFQKNLTFTFFKPAPWVPVLRIETLQETLNGSSNPGVDEKLKEILGIVQAQCVVPSMLEPLGLWLADKVAKQVHSMKFLWGRTNAASFPELFKPNRTEEI